MGRPYPALRTTASIGTAAVLFAGAALAAAPAAAARTPAAPVAASAPGLEFHDIPGSGGITLKGNVFTPAGAEPGAEHPLIVLPTSWGLPQVEYFAQAQQLADSGYVVVSYTSRGFWLSGGKIEVAGPPDLADVSSVIDWALANTPSDPDRIGMGGVSYGAGISLLAAGHDKRIKAVVALSGWADLIDSIYSGRTQHLQAAALLGGSGLLTGRPSDELTRTLTDFLGSDLAKEEDMIAWGKKRSPAAYLDEINANGAAVMMGNAWGDTIFPPNQYASFYEKLSGPKRLEFRPGDHATAEATGLLGLPNDTWADAHRWFDRYLKGERNGIDQEPPVQLKSRTDGGYEGYPDWKSVGAAEERIGLDGTKRILANIDSGANGGIVMLSNALDQFVKLPPIASVPLLPRAFAGVWQSGKYATPRHVRGTVKVHTTVTPNKESGTFVAYLYDEGPLGLGKLVSNAPYTFHGRTPGRPFPVDLELFSTAYDVPAGHRLTLVIDTVDPLYIEHNPTGSQLTFSSSPADPSYVSVPLREK
ncbi:prolyl oligopeptidase family serine peptidase [Streptomyces sp. NBC_00257]|uniref:CocE/NonD family hydrolase n=1 Tax=unclassified Streptomyces TaxID=2593676 RepID=UPI002252977B|nr:MULTISPECIES: CocE/NonD family hydrolase [unclassified Streptomyces]WTB57773.1 prolyl oligopeptidase family serine peptidase [Streptomyces sp. NBC_00826]WTH89346.1 prolyl oligopeptidase family serine peptidase [Streptomyces sp. NBC_00825]WTH98072.1 prolyl oligopeptidase family serine peptidase [Streptomyces sp. NBC_00822]MCX4863331.1 prolyl oligopeptidase family serine peptidase [Streptomyces sp. NBC_00906]MCX4894568.1 prolyl oligopeptidase family serine peptidase [Streptomyces sp. NBC_0089